MTNNKSKIILFMWMLLICGIGIDVAVITFNFHLSLYIVLYLIIGTLNYYITNESGMNATERSRAKLILNSYTGFLIAVLSVCLINTWTGWFQISYSHRITGVLALPIFLIEISFLLKSGKRKG